jgi:hypothetical protein
MWSVKEVTRFVGALVRVRLTEMDTRLRRLVAALGALARSKGHLGRSALVERNIDDYLKAEADHPSRALERLRNVIHDEEAAGRSGEDWSIALNYVRRLLHKNAVVG